jgi:hypothetical protein
MPAVRSALKTLGLSVAGPSVQTIFALRESALAADGFESMVIVLVYRLLTWQEKWRGTREGLHKRG